MFGLTAPAKIPLGGSPDMVNCFVRGNTLRKRPGFSPLGDRLHATENVMGIFSTVDEDDVSFLFATTETGLQRYNAGTNVWTDYTGPALTGGDDHLFSWEVSQNSVVFCQGVDQVMRVPFTGTAYAILNANCPPARYLARFADRLYIGHTVETGAQKPFRVRRSINGDHTNWTGLGSGFTDLSEFPYHITGLKKHGAQLLIPTKEAIWLATRTSISAAPARFDPVVAGAGNYSPYTLTSRMNDHLMVGQDHFYLFNGSRVVEVGNVIRDSAYFNIDAGNTHLNFAARRPETDEWLIFLVEPGHTTANAVWVWNAHLDIWFRWEVSGPICAAIHRLDSTRTWDGLIGSWEEQGWTWTSSEGVAGAPVLVSGHSDGYVHIWKDEYTSDNGSPISCRWTSKDFSSSLLLQQLSYDQLMLKSLAIEYEGTGLEVTLNFFVSTDGGETWGGPHQVTLGTADGTAVMAEKYTGNMIRWKFEHASDTETFRIRRFIPEFEIVGMPLMASA